MSMVRSPTIIPIRPCPGNLQDLIAALRDGDGEIGLAFDGDGDRLGVVTKAGEIIFPDRQLMLYAADMLSRNRGATVNLRCKVDAQSQTLDRAPWRQSPAMENGAIR
jgi:phosphomannomutase